MKTYKLACKVAKKRSGKFPGEFFVIYSNEENGLYHVCTGEELDTFFYGTPNQNIKAVFCAGEYQE